MSSPLSMAFDETSLQVHRDEHSGGGMGMNGRAWVVAKVTGPGEVNVVRVNPVAPLWTDTEVAFLENALVCSTSISSWRRLGSSTAGRYLVRNERV